MGEGVGSDEIHPTRAGGRVNTNVYDRQLMADGRLLHHLGIMLQRDEHNVATPAPSTLTPVCAWCDQDAGIKRAREENITHGICARHKAMVLNPDLESQRRQAA